MLVSAVAEHRRHTQEGSRGCAVVGPCRALGGEAGRAQPGLAPLLGLFLSPAGHSPVLEHPVQLPPSSLVSPCQINLFLARSLSVALFDLLGFSGINKAKMKILLHLLTFFMLVLCVISPYSFLFSIAYF